MSNIITEQPIKGAKETFSWLTDIIETKNGREHRIGLRALPRVSYEYSFLTHIHNRNYYLNSLRNNFTEIWLIPDWLSGIYLGELELGQKTIPNILNQKVGDKFLIYQNAEHSEVNEWLQLPKQKPLEFVFIEPQKTKLVFELKKRVPVEKQVNIKPINYHYKAAYILPLMPCYLTNTKYTTSGYESQIDISVELSHELNFSSGANYGIKYLGLEVLHNCYGVNESTIQKDIEIVDYDLGKITRIENWQYSKLSRSLTFYLDGLKEIQAFKKFIYRIEGKLNAFWLCDNDENLVKTHILGDKIYIENQSFNPSFKYLALFHPDSVSYVKIINIKNTGKSIQLTIDQVITKPITKISHLMLCRFDTDDIQIEYDTYLQAQSNIPIIEVFDDQYF